MLMPCKGESTEILEEHPTDSDDRIVSENISSALILEDDVDWDLRIRQQLQDFALATRALIQPGQGSEGRTHFNVTIPTGRSEGATRLVMLMHGNLPITITPSVSPYGDNWDVLHLGHCGTRSPALNVPKEWRETADLLPEGHVIKLNDPTVPEPH